MPIYKITMGFRRGRFTATETFWTNASDLNAVGVNLQELVNARNELHFQTTQWVGIRITEAGVPRKGKLYPPGVYTALNAGIPLTIPAQGNLVDGDQPVGADQERACLQIRVEFDTNRHTTRYMAFVPDAVITTELKALTFGGFPGLKMLFDNYVAEVISSRWLIKCRDRRTGFAPANINNWTQSASDPKNLGIVLVSATAPPIVQGEFVQISNVRRRGTDKVSYNGRYYVDAINSTLQPGNMIYYLRGTEEGDPASVKLPGTVQRIGTDYQPIQRWLPFRAGIHKRGGSFGRAVGKHSKRISLDP